MKNKDFNSVGARFNPDFTDIPPATKQLAYTLAAVLNKDATPAQIYRAVERFNSGFQPRIYTLKKAFSAISETASVSQTVDNTYCFFCNEWMAKTNSGDDDQFITGLTIGSGTNQIVGNFPLEILSGWTAMADDWFMFVPASSQFILSLQNGSSTQNTTVYVSFKGLIVPTNYVNQINQPKAG